jgi:hypothetical protein
MKQITILAETGKDMIAEVTAALARAGVNISSIAGEHYGGQAVVNVTVNNEERALACLADRHDWKIMSEDALLIKINDEVGALAVIARRFVDAGIALKSIRFIERHQEYALVAVSSGDPEKARALLQDVLAV